MKDFLTQKRLEQLADPSGFAQAVYDAIAEGRASTRFAAYEVCELEYQALLGMRRYTSYDSFVQVANRLIRRRRRLSRR